MTGEAVTSERTTTSNRRANPRPVMTISNVARLKSSSGIANGRRRLNSDANSSSNSDRRNASGRISNAQPTSRDNQTSAGSKRNSAARKCRSASSKMAAGPIRNDKLKRSVSVTGNSSGISSRNSNDCSSNNVARRKFSVVRQISETSMGNAATMINAGLRKSREDCNSNNKMRNGGK